MPPEKEARMACDMPGRADFLKQQEILRDHCASALKEHLEDNPDVIWTPEDGEGQPPTTKEEETQLKLIVNIEFDPKTDKPILPPINNRLSDELVYLVSKFTNALELSRRYPYDFDKMGHIKPERVSSGPSPIIWAHGLPFFPIYKGYYILCGREHAKCIGWLLHERTREIMQANPSWSVGAVIAPETAVSAQHTITRQMTQHKPYGPERESRYKGKASARDFVAAEHHLCAVLPDLITREIEVGPLWQAWGYNVRCGPVMRGVRTTIVPKEFFDSHGLEDIDYEHFARPYGNHLLDEDEETDDEMNAGGGNHPGDLAGQSDEVASSRNRSASQMDFGMDGESSMDLSKQATDGIHKEVSEEDPEEFTEEAMEVRMKQVTGEILKDLESTPSGLEEEQHAVSSRIMNTELSLGIWDSIKEFIDERGHDQTSTAALAFTDAVIQIAARAHQTQVQLMSKQPETKQAVTDAATNNTLPIELPNAEQSACEQPGTQRLDHGAARDLSEVDDETGLD
ncbi:hypothetical protein CBS147326_9479 [Penicillium roqueforti]|nr:hypothetical protein LCP963914a_1907 [Penicillium roqueforti]KAI2729010.1 hypothetical protein CBS147354_1458 [Penicillium roqueforti]KAI3120513.1 hypothetical protein CBS147326_9479 [Penicillium roqueforti]KAI3203108.1 hypothetical protein CBS147311_4209 [Penicillium roqueforti]KAI3270144.1 hypothetical protein CBS147309_5311 [Penicillium roqueforti]